MTIDLHGYRYSVYAWIARLALHEKGVPYAWHEINPFADPVPPGYLALHPFKRVPVLVHGGFAVYETNAIARYIDEAFAGPDLQPDSAPDRARMNQIVSVVDSYAYWPLVRQVFSHGVFRPRAGVGHDPAEARDGLTKAPAVLAALDSLAVGGEFLVGHRLSLADIHLAPMIAYFAALPEAAGMLEDHAGLSVWWKAMSARPTMRETWPPLPSPAA